MLSGVLYYPALANDVHLNLARVSHIWSTISSGLTRVLISLHALAKKSSKLDDFKVARTYLYVDMKINNNTATQVVANIKGKNWVKKEGLENGFCSAKISTSQ
jgi:hypothetical protein